MATKSKSQSSRSQSSGSSKMTTDHDEIRAWAEARQGTPSCVRGTGDKGDVGLLRIDFPGFSGEDTLQPIGWDEFFEKFDEQGLAMVYSDEDQSRFNKLVRRDNAKTSSRSGGG